MKNVLFALLFVVIFHPFALYAQGTTYNGGNLTISSDDDIPLNVATITTIDGNLILEGGLTFFPNFALLNEVQGDLVIQNLSHAPLTELNGLFSALNTIDGDLTFINNAHLGVITGFHALDTLGGDFFYRRYGCWQPRIVIGFGFWGFGDDTWAFFGARER